MTATNPDRTSEIRIDTGGMAVAAVMARTGRLLALEWPPAGLATRWRVGNEHFTTAADARAALVRAAIVALEQLPPCGMAHDEHMAAWRSWRDDCVDPDNGCGFAVRDVDQCDRGHPDDGVTWCGACGHEKPTPPAI